MKDNIILSAAAAFAAASFAFCATSCRQGLKVEKEMPVAICPVSQVSLATRTVLTGGAFPEKRPLFLSAYYLPEDKDENAGNYFVNQLFESAGDGVWKSSYYWPSTGSLSFLGYSAESLPVKVSWQEGDASGSLSLEMGDNCEVQDDVLVGCSDLSHKCKVLDMKFKHMFALVTFKGRSDADYDADLNTGVTLNRIIVRNASFSGKAEAVRKGSDLDIVWNESGEGRDREISGLQMTNLNVDPTPVMGVPLLVAPGEQQPLTIFYTLHMGRNADGSPVNRDLEYTARTDGMWSAGTSTNYTIAISVRTVRVEASVTEWIESPESIAF